MVSSHLDVFPKCPLQSQELVDPFFEKAHYKRLVYIYTESGHLVNEQLVVLQRKTDLRMDMMDLGQHDIGLLFIQRPDQGSAKSLDSTSAGWLELLC